MATRNGNMTAFKTAKMKEPLKTTNASPANASSATALTNGTKVNSASSTPATSPTAAGSKKVWPTLPSFAPPRDLTLGGKAPKKVFTPNLNVVRNKNLNVKTSKDTTKSSARGGRGRGASTRGGNTRGGKASTLIQTKGVFSEGAGEFNIRKSSSSSFGRYSSGGGEDSSSALQKPVLNKYEFKKIDLKEDERKLHDITGESDEEECYDNYKTEGAEDDLPIRLNRAKRRAKLLNLKQMKNEMLIKQEEQKIKKEPTSDDEQSNDDAATLATAQKLQKLHVDSKLMDLDEPLDGQSDGAHHSALPRYPPNVNEFLEANASQLFLLQLPDILPCENDTDPKDSHFKKDSKPLPIETEMPSSSGAGTTRLNLKADYDWKTMQEGQIGKIIRYKSGKNHLQLGKTLFDLDVAMEPGFMQDVISIKTNDDYEHSTGSMINLGPIHAKIKATPYWEDCMKHFETEGNDTENA